MTLYIAALVLWSALHLLWQGALVVAVFEWWRRTSRPSPSTQYTAAIGCLVVLGSAFVMNGVIAHFALLGNARLGADGALLAEQGRALSRVVAGFDDSFDSMRILALLWAVGLAVGIIRLTLGAQHLSRLQRRSSRAPHAVVERVGTLARQMMVAEPQVLVSDSRIGPFVMGRAPGVLMLPNDFEPGEELDALILHELAHLRRRDSESNLFLRAIHALLWFHPAVWRLTTAAVNAREESCDVDAVSQTRNALVLARALVRLAEQRQRTGAMLAASHGALTTRVRHLISGTQAHGDSGAVPTAVSLAVFVAGSVAAATLAPLSDRLALVGAEANALPAQQMVIDAHDPAGRFSLTLLNGRVASATIAGVPVARPAIHRQERTLSLSDLSGAAVVAVQFDPRGSIRWMPRASH